MHGRSDTRQRALRISGIVGALLLLAPSSVAAQQDRDWRNCLGSDADAKVAGCTRIVERAGEPAANRANAHVRRGVVYLTRHDFDRAIADFEQAVRLDPKMADAYGNRGMAYRQKGDLDQALRDFDEAIRLAPRDGTMYNNRGATLRDKGDLGRALADLNESIRLDPKDARPYFHRGVVHQKMGDLPRALSDLRKSLQMDPAQADAREALAQIEAGVAKPSESAPAEPRAAATEPRPAEPRTAAIDPAPPAPPVASPPPAPAAKPAAAPAQPERRVALLVGNSAYAAVPQLANPRRDVQTVAAALRKLGFDVDVATDLTREGLLKALLAFARKADKADWAMVFFVGHGIEVGGTNYLIPVDARLATDRDVVLEAVPLEQVLGAVERAGKLRRVLLDAFRDNPFANQMRRTLAGRSVGRGFARVEPEAGTLVVYSAKHGEIALDGDSGNSPFVVALVKNLALPGVELRRVFDLVRDDVLEATNRQQQPFSYGSLPGREDFFFVQK